MIKELDEKQLYTRYAIEGSAHVRDALMLKAALGETQAWDETADLLLFDAMASGDGLAAVPTFLVHVYVHQAAHAVALLALHLAGGDHDGAQLLLRGTRPNRAADADA